MFNPNTLRTRNVVLKRLGIAGLTLLSWLSAPNLDWAQDLSPIVLPAPRLEGGRPLMQVLQARQTVRDFKSNSIPLPMLSDLLWAGFGINRATNEHRTAPSAMNSQEIDIYVATAEGVYLYEAKAHQLQPVIPQDIRAKTGGGAFAPVAPVTLLFVADYARMPKAKPEQKPVYSAMDAAFISQNVYLYCASERLGTVVHDLDRAPLLKLLPLGPTQQIVLAQAVGWPK